MKKIRTEWTQTPKGADSILSIISLETGREIAQLRRPNGNWRRNQSWIYERTWGFRPMTMTDDTINVLFGNNWYYESYSGFDTVEGFRNWAREKQCL